MRLVPPEYSVFLSYSAGDAATATALRSNLENSGVRTFDARSSPLGENIIDAIMSALAECDAVVVLYSEGASQSPWVPMELGAAMAVAKPIYVLADAPHADLPDYLARFRSFQLSDVASLVRQLLREARPLEDKDRQALQAAYAKVGIPSDQLFRDVDGLGKIASAFTGISKRRVGGERLLRELIRMRKQGHLPSLKVKRRAPAHRFAKSG